MGAAALLAASLAAAGSSALAQELEPRSYANAPVGLNFLIAGYGYAAGGVTFDPSVPLTNAHVQTHGAVLAYVRALDFWGKSGKVDIVLPYAWVSGSAEVGGELRERSVSGPGDPRLRLSVNLLGAPALSPQEFAGYRQDLILGVSLQVWVPLGQYDGDFLVNIGTNRWAFKPELGISKALGRLTLELAAGVAFYTENSDFYGGVTRAQDPISSVQGHVIYAFGNGIWAALNGTYYAGGRTTTGGVEGDDLQTNSRLGLTVALPVNRRNSLKLYGSTGTSTRTGSDFDAVGVAWQFRWGGGL